MAALVRFVVARVDGVWVSYSGRVQLKTSTPSRLSSRCFFLVTSDGAGWVQ